VATSLAAESIASAFLERGDTVAVRRVSPKTIRCHSRYRFIGCGRGEGAEWATAASTLFAPMFGLPLCSVQRYLSCNLIGDMGASERAKAIANNRILMAI